MTPDDIADEVRRLAPWHLKVEIRDGLDTSIGASAGADGPRVSFVDGKAAFVTKMKRIYPDGLAGKSFIDHACNCGGYSFWAKELGAERVFGYDVRDHWVEQAEFLRRTRSADASGIVFGRHDLYDLPKLGLEPFDVTYFKGIFYHLPDPVAGLKIAADLTREVLYLSTDFILRVTDPGNGGLILAKEATTPLMSGVYGLNWYPTGPRVLETMLNWMGFPETRVTDVRLYPETDARNTKLEGRAGRIGIVAARRKGTLEQVKATQMP
jgi:SAM-dependent methyltransferase